MGSWNWTGVFCKKRCAIHLSDSIHWFLSELISPRLCNSFDSIQFPSGNFPRNFYGLRQENSRLLKVSWCRVFNHDAGADMVNGGHLRLSFSNAKYSLCKSRFSTTWNPFAVWGKVLHLRRSQTQEVNTDKSKVLKLKEVPAGKVSSEGKPGLEY